MKKFLVLSLIVLSCNALLAQQMNALNHFMYNQLVFSPASAGMHDAQFNLSALTRFQWTSVEGAPKSALAWADYRTPSRKMSLGIVANRVSQAGYRSTDLNLNYAYAIRLNEKFRLSMGLRAGFSNVKNSTSEYVIWDANDPYESSSNFSTFIPKFGMGFQLNSKSTYLNLSAPDLIAIDKTHFVIDTAAFIKRNRNYIMMVGTVIPFGDLYNIRPNVIVNYYSPLSGLVARFNTNFEIKDYFWIGASYSTAGSFSAVAGTHINRRMRLAYSYEVYTASSKGNVIGAHEINLLLNMNNIVRKKVIEE